MAQNISGFGIGDRIRLRVSSSLDGAIGTVIGIASETNCSFIGRDFYGYAVVKLDNGQRCGEFAFHEEQEGCVVAKQGDNAVLIARALQSFGIEDLI